MLQIDCIRAGQIFKQEDLEMLTAIALQAGMVLQNAAYHAERLREARALLGVRCWSGAYYLAGYAIECGLKACIIKYLMTTDQRFEGS